VGYRPKAVIVGAGLSGLSCAFRLHQLGIPALVLEASDRPGGVIATVRRNGFVFETGPQFPRFPASVWHLVRDLNLQSEFLAGNAKAKRYILRGGRLHRAPFSPTGLLSTQLLGRASKYRVLTEVFGSSCPPDSEETLAQFVERKFGSEVLDNLVDPIVSAVFLGDAQKMGMLSAFPALVEWERRSGSLVRGALRSRRTQRNGAEDSVRESISRLEAGATNDKTSRVLHVTDALPSLGSFKQGMSTLADRLALSLRGEIRYGAQITSVGASPGGGISGSGWRIALATGEELEADHLILAVPAYAAARLLANAEPEVASQLASIEYAPLCVVASTYERSEVTHNLDGFGFMVPRREGLRTICTFWNSSLFPNRAPQGKVLITSFARPHDCRDAGVEIRERRSPDQLECAAEVTAENAKILGITGEPIDQLVWHESRALPQYNIGHARTVAEIQELLGANGSLHLIGNYLHGRSIGDCVDHSFRIAANLHARMHGSIIQTSSESVEEETHT
jgi:oxygen-dependent protoporphyrinogen oxidase